MAQTKTQMIKQLDPRLRRLIRSKDSLKRLERDRTRLQVESTMEQPDLAEQYTKRVLVRCAVGDPKLQHYTKKVSHIVDRIYALEIPVTELEDLADDPMVEYIEAGRQLTGLLDTSVTEAGAQNVVRPSGTALDGSNVVVGIIDFGMDYTLDDFRNSNGDTRIKFLWDQNLTPQSSEISPRFGYGVEYTEASINQALTTPNPFSVVRHQPSAGSHGTHVAGTAVGNGRTGDTQFPPGQFVGVAPGADIVYVQPNTSDANSTFTDSVNVAEAIVYCFEKANELGLPCVINMSLGQNGGSHDGESVVERAIDSLLDSQGRCMVLAAGNEHIWRGHASGDLATGSTTTLNWEVGGGMSLPGGGNLGVASDRTPNEMEIWYSSRDEFRARVTDPSGNVSQWTVPGDTNLDTLPSGDEVFIDSERFSILNGDARIYIEISPQPGGGQTLTTGTWLVEIEASSASNGHYDVWIERDAREGSNIFADQSFFSTAFDGEKTLGTPATTRRGIAVANYDHTQTVPSDSSSRGRTRDDRTKPELAAPGTGIFSSNAMSQRSGAPARLSMSGTSMAAPHVAGAAALLLQEDPRLTSEQIKKILAASARDAAAVGPAFDNAWGFGVLDVQTAVNLL